MRAHTANSLVVSLVIHGTVVALIFLATFVAARRVQEAPVIFELVAGPRTDDGPSLEAPALGNTSQPIKLEVPRIEQVPSMPDEPTVQAPPQPAAVETPPAPVERPKPKAVEKTPEKTKVPEKTKTSEKAKTPEKAKPDNSMAKEMQKNQRISYQQYLKKHPTPKQTAPSGAAAGPKVAKAPRVDATGIAAGVQGGSTRSKSGEGGKALSREMQDRMSTYISLLIQELKKAHEPPPGVNDRLEAQVTFDITAGGAILNPRISRSSGDKAFDQSVLDAFLRMRSIGPTPNRRPDTWTVTFRMRDAA